MSETQLYQWRCLERRLKDNVFYLQLATKAHKYIHVNCYWKAACLLSETLHLKSYRVKMRGKYCSIMKPGFAVSTHFTALHHLSVSINGDSPCYIESELSANEIFKHLKSLKTNLLNVLPFPIKSSVCNYLRLVITKFHDLLCNCVVNVCVCVCLLFLYVPIFLIVMRESGESQL